MHNEGNQGKGETAKNKLKDLWMGEKDFDRAIMLNALTEYCEKSPNSLSSCPMGELCLKIHKESGQSEQERILRRCPFNKDFTQILYLDQLCEDLDHPYEKLAH